MKLPDITYKPSQPQGESEEKSQSANLVKLTAKPDYNHWGRLGVWEAPEAVLLLLDINPKVVTSRFLEEVERSHEYSMAGEMDQIRKIVDQIHSRHELMQSTVYLSHRGTGHAPRLVDVQDTPVFFILWAERMKLEIPEKLAQSVAEFADRPSYDDLLTENLRLMGVERIVARDAAPPKNEAYSTVYLGVVHEAISKFFKPDRNTDPKKDEVVTWIKSRFEEMGLNSSNRIAEAIFTIIKPADHNPRRRRG